MYIVRLRFRRYRIFCVLLCLLLYSSIVILYSDLFTLSQKKDQIMASSLTWEEMIERLLEIFDSEVVNIEEVEAVLEEYQSCQSDWEKYAKFDQYKYTRNLVHRGTYQTVLPTFWSNSIVKKSWQHWLIHKPNRNYWRTYLHIRTQLLVCIQIHNQMCSILLCICRQREIQFDAALLASRKTIHNPWPLQLSLFCQSFGR